MQHPSVNASSVPLAVTISSDHTTAEISNSLNTWFLLVNHTGQMQISNFFSKAIAAIIDANKCEEVSKNVGYVTGVLQNYPSFS